MRFLLVKTTDGEDVLINTNQIITIRRSGGTSEDESTITLRERPPVNVLAPFWSIHNGMATLSVPVIDCQPEEA